MQLSYDYPVPKAIAKQILDSVGVTENTWIDTVSGEMVLYGNQTFWITQKEYRMPWPEFSDTSPDGWHDVWALSQSTLDAINRNAYKPSDMWAELKAFFDELVSSLGKTAAYLIVGLVIVAIVALAFESKILAVLK